jgi:hypothetical protein
MGIDRLCGRLDEFHHLVRVGDHCDVVCWHLDRGCAHALSEKALGVRRDRLIGVGRPP